MRKHKLLASLAAMASAVCIATFAGGMEVKADDGVHYLRPYQSTSSTEYNNELENNFKMSGQEFNNGIAKNNGDQMSAEFNLNKEVDSVSFVVGHIDGADNADATMKIYLDGVVQTEYTKKLTYDMITQSINIQTTGYSQLKIVIEGYWSHYGLGNITEVGKHNYSYEITKVATVNNDGLVTYTCDDCGYTYEVIEPAKEYCEDYLMPYQVNRMSEWKEAFGSSKYFEVMGEKYYRGLTKDNGDVADALYNLGGKYNYVSFTVGHTDDTDRADSTLKVYIDGVEVKNIPLDGYMNNKEVTVDTTGATQLKIELTGYWSHYALVDIYGDAVDKTYKSHSFEKQTMIAAQFGVTGIMKHVCTNCGAYYTSVIPALTRNLTDTAVKVTLSKDNYAYDGKAKKPSVTVTYNGDKLKKGTDYTVSYSNNTKAGTATVSIKGKGFYKKTKKVTFIINPGKTSIASVKNQKSCKAVVTLKKNTQATGYEVQYSRYDSFWYPTTVDAKSKTSVTFKNLYKGNTYYVRARAYKTIKGTKYYGDYSSVKKVTIKK